MLVNSLIKDDIPPLKSSDTVERALIWMEQFRHSQLPVISEVGYIGVVHERDLRLIEDKDTKITETAVPINRLFLKLALL